MTMNWEKRLKEFKRRLNEIKETSKSDSSLYAQLHFTNQYLAETKAAFLAVESLNPTDEIAYFKRIKPLLVSYSIFYSEIIAFHWEMPDTGKKSKNNFIDKRIQRIQKFFNRHKFFDYYIRSGQSHLDEHFFLRNNQTPYDPDNLDPYADLHYSTSRDLLAAKLLAYHRMLEYLKKIRKSTVEGQNISHLDSSLNWTGSRTDLTELIYALYHSKVINHGDADIIKIATALSSLLNIDLGDVYKTYSEIKIRKKSRTKFLDSLAIQMQFEMQKIAE